MYGLHISDHSDEITIAQSDQADDSAPPTAASLTDQAMVISKTIEQSLINLERPLPALAQWLPSNMLPRAGVPGVVIAWFENDSDDHRHWGGALSELLRILLADLPGAPIQQPPLRLSELDHDSWREGHGTNAALQDRDSLRQVGRVHGFNAGLVGTVHRRGEQTTIEVQWIDLNDDSIPASVQHQTVDNEGLVNVLVTLAQWCLERLNVRLAVAAQDSLVHGLPAAALLDYVTLFTRWRVDGDEKAACEQAKAMRGTNFLAAMLADLGVGNTAARGSTRSAESAAAVARDPQRHQLAMLSVLAEHHLGFRTLKKSMAEELIGLLAHTASGAADAELWWHSSRMLAEAGDTAGGLRLALASLQIWPASYRSWWALANRLQAHGWAFRGHQYWHAIGPREQTLFCELMTLGEQAAEIGLSIHPNSPGLLLERMSLEGGCSETMLSAFERALELAPHWPDIYHQALNFSAPKWGGDIDLQLEIVALAMENNPDQRWPLYAYLQYLGLNPEHGLWRLMKLMFYRNFRRTNWPRSALGKI